VYDGIVEVRSDRRREPLLVPAGQMANFSRREPPISRPMPPERGTNDRNPDGTPHDPHGAPPSQPHGAQPQHGNPPPPNTPPPTSGGHH
jgi:hypothetical protein